MSLVLEKALEQRVDDEGAGVADVDAAVDRRSAGVDADVPVGARDKLAQGSGSRVVQADRGHADDPIEQVWLKPFDPLDDAVHVSCATSMPAG